MNYHKTIIAMSLIAVKAQLLTTGFVCLPFLSLIITWIKTLTYGEVIFSY